MGRRDYRHREPKKGKKDVKKSPEVKVLPTPLGVAVVGKGKRREREAAET